MSLLHAETPTLALRTSHSRGLCTTPVLAFLSTSVLQPRHLVHCDCFVRYLEFRPDTHFCIVGVIGVRVVDLFAAEVDELLALHPSDEVSDESSDDGLGMLLALN